MTMTKPKMETQFKGGSPFGGFGSVPGALAAGLIIGVIQSVSAYWFGPVYKDVIVYALFVAILWIRPQGLMGKI